MSERTVRGKFNVHKIEMYSYPEGSAKVELGAVYKYQEGVSGNACEENRMFGEATPQASVSMLICNPKAVEVFRKAFEEKKPFYVDFTPAEE